MNFILIKPQKAYGIPIWFTGAFSPLGRALAHWFFTFGIDDDGVWPTEKKTSKNTKLQINLALNYGSKSELIDAFKKIKKSKSNISEKNLSRNLQTKNIPDPDLLIRTGNTKRLSNFLLWQLAYSEIFFEKKLWPAFNEKDYDRIIKEYRNIKRNFGKI